ncbi:hypothetical protein OROGR_008338 [Orobanche gracilis]
MEIRLIWLGLLLICFKSGLGEPIVYSARLVHRYSDEAKAHAGFRVLNNGAQVAGDAGLWPRRQSLEYYRLLLSRDLQRQTLKLNPQFQFLYPSEGSGTLPLGNDFGWSILNHGVRSMLNHGVSILCVPGQMIWHKSLFLVTTSMGLHYMWIDIGTPKISFLVALDAGSDLFWIPCDCVQCAPLSASYYSTLRCSLVFGASIVQDKDLNEYNPSSSSTSKTISCSHELCDLGPKCPNPKQQCPYTVNYSSEDTSTSGYLVEDVLHLISGHSDGSHKSVGAPVIIGCGSKQTGSYLSGVAPDGLLGLGLGEISVPSLLAKAGYIKNSLSLCFNDDDTGRLFFGNQGVAGQETTQFLPLDGKNLTYIVGVDACCIERACLNHTNFEMLVDSGSSFTFLPVQIYQRVAVEFDRQVNVSKSIFDGYPWEYCYEFSSHEVPKVPSLTLKFATTKGFVVENPVFVIYGTQGALGFCLAVQRTTENIGTIGQNFMMGQDVNNGVPNTSSNSDSPNSLPTIEQRSPPKAVAPAIAGRTPSTSSPACPSCLVKILLFLHLVHYLLNL